jgi:hypothetical protein
MKQIIVRNLSGEQHELNYTDAQGDPQTTIIYGGACPLPPGATVAEQDRPKTLYFEVVGDEPDPVIVETPSGDSAPKKKG